MDNGVTNSEPDFVRIQVTSMLLALRPLIISSDL